MAERKTKGEIIERLRVGIEERGYDFQFVLPGEDSPPYIYTVGLSETFHHPEIYLVGLPPEHAAPLIDDIVVRIAAGERFDQPTYVEDLIQFDMPVRPMTDATVAEHAGTGWEVLGGPFKAVQLFYPDKSGFVPWEPECAPHYADPQLFFELEGPPPVRIRPIPEVDMTPQPPLSPEEIATRRREFTAHMRKVVETDGFTFQPVMSGGDGPNFFYSIGLSATFDHPEIFVVGLEPAQAHGLLMETIDLIKKGARFDKPCLISEISDITLAVRPLVDADVDQHSGIGQEVLQKAFHAVQLFYPDPNGFLPWEVGCDPEYSEEQLSAFRAVGYPPDREPPVFSGTIH